MKKRKKKEAFATPPAENETVEDETVVSSGEFPGPPAESTDYAWLASCLLIGAVAAFVRFFRLELKPFHHDEGVNGYFLTTLFREGKYQYDPANYHGPDLYYLSLAFAKAFGLNTVSVRSSVAVFGVLTVVTAFLLRRYIGKTGALFAALFLALSPGMVYISRYFIHEMLFVYFSLTIVVAMVSFIERRKAGVFAITSAGVLMLVCFLPSTLSLAARFGGDSESTVWTFRIVLFLFEAVLVAFVLRMLLAWQDGRPLYLLLASASVSLLFATKETGFITVGTMVIACGCVWLWRRLNAADSFAAARFWILAVPTGIVLLSVLIDYKRYLEGYRWLSDQFLGLDDPYQKAVFYGILAISVLTLGVWLVILYRIRTRTEDGPEFAEPAELTWSALRERMTATDDREVLLVKSGIAAATVFVVWFFVRVVVEMLISWKSGNGAMKGFYAIDLGRVDAVILGFGFALLGVAAFVYLAKRPQTISADFVLLSSTAVVVFFYVGAVFFSSFFSYPEGLQGAFKAYAIWTKTGSTDHTQNGMLAYVRWGMKVESPILVLSALGFLISLVRVRHRFAMFAGLWALGLFLAYTIIPYKTPWLALSFLLPMCVSAGYAVNELIGSRRTELKVAGVALAGIAALILTFQTYDLNFERYDDDSMPYVYAHTRREFLDLVRAIDYHAEKSGRGHEASVEVVSPDYWPMPWYLNDYKAANFHGRLVDASTAEMIVAKKDEQDPDVVARYAGRYRYAGQFTLRPGVDLMLLVRRDLADSDSMDVHEALEGLTVVGEP